MLEHEEKDVVGTKSFGSIQEEINALSPEKKDQILSSIKDSLNRQIPWYAKLFHYIERFIKTEIFVRGIHFEDRKKLRIRDALNSELLKSTRKYNAFSLTLGAIWAFVWQSSDHLAPEKREHAINGMHKMLSDNESDDVQDFLNHYLDNPEKAPKSQAQETVIQEEPSINVEPPFKENQVEHPENTALPAIREGVLESSLFRRNSPTYFTQNQEPTSHQTNQPELENALDEPKNVHASIS